LVLSCNHVLANSNAAQINDCISQLGGSDGGTCPDDQVAILERAVLIDFSGRPNYVDCATGWCWPDRVRPELVNAGAAGVNFFRMGTTPVQRTCNQAVGKTGRTTGLTLGYVRCQVTSIIAYYEGRGAVFQNQIAIEGSGGPFADYGDSGALVWTWDGALSPIGLFFAAAQPGTVLIAFANPIDLVLSSLDINILNAPLRRQRPHVRIVSGAP
jgi:hypothetical protein